MLVFLMKYFRKYMLDNLMNWILKFVVKNI